MLTQSGRSRNPFAIRVLGPKNVESYVLAHQPKSLDWRARKAKVHAWKKASPEVFEEACETLNQIIEI